MDLWCYTALYLIDFLRTIFLIVFILYVLNQISIEKFNYKLLSKGYFIGGVFLLGRNKAYVPSKANNGDILNGYILIILILSVYLFVKTDIWFVILGTTLNMLIFCLGTKYILILIAIVVFLYIFLTMVASGDFSYPINDNKRMR